MRRDKPDKHPGGIVEWGRRRHVASGTEDDWDVNLLPERVGVSLGEEVEGDGQERADEEKPKDNAVRAGATKHLGRADDTPDHGGRVEGLGLPASPRVGSGGADILDATVQPACGSQVDEGSDDSANQLNGEHHARRHLEVVTKLQIIDECDRLNHGDVAISLEACNKAERHLPVITFKPGVMLEMAVMMPMGNTKMQQIPMDRRRPKSTKKKSKIKKSKNQKSKKSKKSKSKSTIPKCTYPTKAVSQIIANHVTSKSCREAYLRVVSHELGVDIITFGAAALPLRNNLFAVPQGTVDQDGSQAGEANAVGDGKERREAKGPVFLVGGLVECNVLVDDLGLVVGRAVDGKQTGSKDRISLGIPDVGIVEDGHDYPSDQKETGEDIEMNPSGNNQGVAKVGCHDRPVKGKGEHGETAVSAGQLTQNDVVGGNPASPREDGEDRDEVAGNPVPDKANATNYQEPLNTGHTLARLGNVEGAEHGNVDKTARPDHRRRVHKEWTENASQTVSNALEDLDKFLLPDRPTRIQYSAFGLGETDNKIKTHLRGQDEEETTTPAEILTVENLLHGDDINGVGRLIAGVYHGDNQNVLLHVESTGIEEWVGWDNLFHEPAHRQRNQLHDQRSDCDRLIAEPHELVDECKEAAEKKPQ
ncbi:hypothetical protein BC937DRAFT_94077 [Endogone sp. FLAS-F59071]|nr:hypothetical protein BC937DRAFT_94077 [Endogone sp. FLAS-F59071]|eukprot:RUS20911.1 hypothetical protein BC937DRAFT_94077 [Endogone sp. FLAS-F59071]